MSKAIRSKLNLSKSDKSSSVCESASSFDHDKFESGAAHTENGNTKIDSKEHSSSSNASTPADKNAPQLKVAKKKSKLCLLL